MTASASASASASAPQRIFFDGAMRPIEEVAAALLEFGRSVDYIFRFFEFRLGVGQFAGENEASHAD